MRVIVAFNILFFATIALKSQNVDSLYLLLKNTTQDTVRLRIRNEIGIANEIYRLGYWDSLYIDAKKNNNKQYQLCALTRIGSLYYIKTDYINAIEIEFKALKIADELKDKKNLGAIYTILGLINDVQKNKFQALAYLFKALKCFTELNNQIYIAKTYNNLSTVYLHNQNYETALNYSYKYLDIVTKLNNKQLISKACANIGVNFLERDKYTDAKLWLNRSLNEFNATLDSSLYIYIIYNLSECMGNDREAEIKYKLQALKGMKALHYYIGMDKCSFRLSEIYEKRGDFAKALFYHKEFVAARDSLNFEKNKEELLKSEMNYEFDKKETAFKNEKIKNELIFKNDTQRKKSIIYLLIAGLITLILSISTFILYNRKKKSDLVKRSLQIEQKLLRLQMNPHFIFNSLTALESFIYENHKEKAMQYLTKIAKLIRATLENSRQEYISISKEIEILEHYLSINQLLSNNLFEYKINIDDKINAEDLLIPPMLIQPFVENSLKHGIQHAKTKGLISITLMFHNRNISITIEDNGMGINSIKNDTTHNSLATTITQERLANLFKVPVKQIKINTTELKNNNQSTTGYSINFEVPIKEA